MDCKTYTAGPSYTSLIHISFLPKKSRDIFDFVLILFLYFDFGKAHVCFSFDSPKATFFFVNFLFWTNFRFTGKLPR